MLKTLLATLRDAKEQVASYGETVIDLAADNETWENIPLVEHAIKILKIKDTYKTNKIKRNYAAFIKAVSEMSDSEASHYLELLTSNNAISEDTAETIFDVIVDSQKPIKPQVLGNLSVCLAKRSISIEDYNIIALIIHSCSVAALMALPEFLEDNLNNPAQHRPGAVKNEALLYSLGIGTRHGNKFSLDERGRMLAECGFNIKLST